ncbi:MAG TPA: IS110 family transposase [Bryobacteraceae bacterium]|nr:IS110 family transposase [Bryobacteraceae bacterium]
MRELGGVDVGGLDVSAKELVVMVRREGKTEARRSFPNNPLGHQELRRYLTHQRERVRVCMESTGMYGLDAALVLQADPRIEFMVANPRAVRDFARALMQRSKTDPLDALVLLEYAARMPFQRWTPPPAEALQITALARRIHALTQQSTMEKNRLHAVGASATTLRVIVQDLRRSIRALETAIAKLSRAAHKILAATPELERRFRLLQSAPGIGPVSALQLLGELVLIPANCDVRQWVAYAGLDPRHHDSGSSVHQKARISKVGNRHIRRALYMPALTAVRFAPSLRAFYLHLQARGKCKMVALVAVMRKLLHAIFGMFKSDAAFDGSKVCPALSLAALSEVAHAA